MIQKNHYTSGSLGCNDILESRIAELCICFKSCGYPSSMVDRISKKVLNIPRDLNQLIKKKNIVPTINSPTPVLNVRIISTFGTDKLLVESVKNTIPHLNQTKSFKSKEVSFTYTKKTAPSIGSKLTVSKKMSLGITKGGTTKCGSAKCKCCETVPQTPVPKVIINGRNISLPSGNCKSKNIIYLAQCNLCPHKFYVGRTVQPLNKRVNGHRQNFYCMVTNGPNSIL